MPAEYHHEPAIALVCGNDGLDLVIDILLQAPQFLTDDGMLICEVGNSWGHLEELFPDIEFNWLEFQRGGLGVFSMSKQTLLQHQSLFAQMAR